MSEPLPVPAYEYAYLQPYEHGAENMVLVRCAAFNVPPWESWFCLVLCKQRTHTPLRMVDNIPVFYVEAPRAVMLELVECAKKPARADRAMQAVPTALAGTLNLETWQEYMEQFSVAVIDHTPLPEGPPAKRARTATWFPTAAEVRVKEIKDTTANVDVERACQKKHLSLVAHPP